MQSIGTKFTFLVFTLLTTLTFSVAHADDRREAARSAAAEVQADVLAFKAGEATTGYQVFNQFRVKFIEVMKGKHGIDVTPDDFDLLLPWYSQTVYGADALRALLELSDIQTILGRSMKGPAKGVIRKDENFQRAAAYIKAKAEELGFKWKLHAGTMKLGESEFEDDLILEIYQPEASNVVGIMAHADTIDVSDEEREKFWLFDPFPAKVARISNARIPTTADSFAAFDIEASPIEILERDVLQPAIIFDAEERERVHVYGRGVVDDKAGVIAGLYAMKAIADAGIQSSNAVLYVALGEEKLPWWAPISAVMARLDLPEVTLVADSGGIVNAEMAIHPLFMAIKAREDAVYNASLGPVFKIESLVGGNESFNSVPATAKATLRPMNWESSEAATAALDEAMDAYNEYNPGAKISIEAVEGGFEVAAEGFSAHTMLLHTGRNAIIDLAGFIGGLPLVDSMEADLAAFVNMYFMGVHATHQIHGQRLGMHVESESFDQPTLTNFTQIFPGEGDHEGGLQFSIDLRHPETMNTQGVKDQLARVLEEFHALRPGSQITGGPAPMLLNASLNIEEAIGSEKFGAFVDNLQANSSKVYDEPFPLTNIAGRSFASVFVGEEFEGKDAIGVCYGPWKSLDYAEKFLGYHGVNESAPIGEFANAVSLYAAIIVRAQKSSLLAPAE